MAAATPGGGTPAGTVAFFLDGVPAGNTELYQNGIASFQANPGVYTLTAQYSGDQAYAPAALPARTIIVSETEKGTASDIVEGITTSVLSVSDLGGTSLLTPGTPLEDSFEVGDDNTGPTSAGDFVGVNVIAVSTTNPDNKIEIGNAGTSYESVAHRLTEVPLKVDVDAPALESGSYVLAYQVQTDESYSTIYSDRLITVSDTPAEPGVAVGVGRVSGLSSALVSGTPVRGSAVVTVTAGGTAAVRGRQTVALYATRTGTIDAASTLLGTVQRPLSLAAGGSASVTVPVLTFPATPGGYTVLARVTEAGGPVADATAGPVVSVSDPYVQLSGTVGYVPAAAIRPGRPLSLTLTLANAGNAAAAGPASLAVYLSADGTTPTLAVATRVRPSLAVRPGHPVRLRLTVKVPPTAAAKDAFPLVVVNQGQASTTAVESG